MVKPPATKYDHYRERERERFPNFSRVVDCGRSRVDERAADVNVHSPRDVVSASFFILIDSAPFLWIVRFAVTQIGVGPRFCCLFDFFVFVSTAAGRRRKRWSRCCGRSSMADRLKRKKTETRNEMKHTSFEKRKRHTTTAGGRVRNAADLTSSSPPTQRFHGIAELFFFVWCFLVSFSFFHIRIPSRLCVGVWVGFLPESVQRVYRVLRPEKKTQ